MSADDFLLDVGEGCDLGRDVCSAGNDDAWLFAAKDGADTEVCRGSLYGSDEVANGQEALEENPLTFGSLMAVDETEPNFEFSFEASTAAQFDDNAEATGQDEHATKDSEIPESNSTKVSKVGGKNPVREETLLSVIENRDETNTNHTASISRASPYKSPRGFNSFLPNPSLTDRNGPRTGSEINRRNSPRSPFDFSEKRIGNKTVENDIEPDQSKAPFKRVSFNSSFAKNTTSRGDKTSSRPRLHSPLTSSGEIKRNLQRGAALGKARQALEVLPAMGSSNKPAEPKSRNLKSNGSNGSLSDHGVTNSKRDAKEAEQQRLLVEISGGSGEAKRARISSTEGVLTMSEYVSNIGSQLAADFVRSSEFAVVGESALMSIIAKLDEQESVCDRHIEELQRKKGNCLQVIKRMKTALGKE